MKNKRILLAAVNAKYVHANLALHSLKTFAAPYTELIEIAEFTINQYQEDIVHSIYRKKPDFLAFSCYIWNIDMILEAAETLHRLMPDLPIWLGGPEVSFESRELLEDHPYITGIMQGEGEEVFRRLCAWYVDGEGDLVDIPHIVWREKDVIREGRPFTREDFIPMDDLPFVYEGYLTMPDEMANEADDHVSDNANGRSATKLAGPFDNKIIYYETSRGCPFRCSYCLSAGEKPVRLRSLDKVLRELQIFLDAKVKQVKFVDRTFNANHDHAMAIWQYIKDHDNGVTNFHFELEANVLTEDELDLLCSLRPGLVQTEIGVQSTNEATLRAVRRNPDFEKIVHVSEKIKAAGNAHLHLDLIAGLPEEDLETFKRSFNMVYGLHPNELQLGFLKLLKGSLLREDAVKYGFVAHKQAPYEILSTNWLSFEDILRLKDLEQMLEMFGNSAQFTGTIARLEKEYKVTDDARGDGVNGAYTFDAFAMFDDLAKWYRARGYHNGSHSRMELFSILREFCLEKAPQVPVSEWDDLLLTDLYLRENAKSRPAWAPDLAQYKEERRNFYRQEEAAPVHLQGYEGRDAKTLARMTHLEIREENGKLTGRLFDYAKRNPLTGNAFLSEVTVV